MNIWGWLLSADVLETLFDGLLGAAVGAGVAVVVLRLTLREQRHALAAQLHKQDTHHQDQLRVQREENARARMHDVVANLLEANAAVVGILDMKNPKEAWTASEQINSRFLVDLERFHLDLEEDEVLIYQAISGLLSQGIESMRSLQQGQTIDPADVMAIRQHYGWIGILLIEWVRAAPEDKGAKAQIAHEAALRIEQHGMHSWRYSMCRSEPIS